LFPSHDREARWNEHLEGETLDLLDDDVWQRFEKKEWEQYKKQKMRKQKLDSIL